MLYFILGAAGTLTTLGLVSLGAFFGWKARERFQNKTVQEANEEERRRFEAEQQAFANMLNYNIDAAYGMDRGIASLVGGENR